MPERTAIRPGASRDRTSGSFSETPVERLGELEAQLERRNQEIRALGQLYGKLSSWMSVEETLDAACEQMASLTRVQVVAVFLLDDERRFLTLAGQRNLDPDLARQAAQLPFPAHVLEPGYQPPPLPSLLEYLIGEQRSVVMFDTRTLAVRDREQLEQSGFCSGVASPIRYGQDFFGFLMVGARAERSFDEHDRELVDGVALRLGATLRNRQLLLGSQRQVKELQALAAVAEALSQDPASPEVLGGVAEIIQNTLGSDRATFALYKESGFQVVAASGAFRPVGPSRLQEFQLRVLEKNETVAISDRESDETDEAGRDYLRRMDAGSYMAAPLVSDRRTLGLVSVAQRSPRRWSQGDRRLLRTFAHQIAGFLYRAALLSEERARVRELQAFADLSSLASSLIPETQAIELALGAIQETMTVDLVGVHLLDGDRFRVGSVRGGEPPYRSLELTPMLRAIMVSRQPFVLDAAHPQELDLQAASTLKKHAARSVITMPLAVASGPIGIVSVAFRNSHLWTDAEIRTVKTIANQLAIAIANGRLYQEQLERAHRLRKLRELSEICSMNLDQASLLPAVVGKVHGVLNATRVSLRLVDGDCLGPRVGVGFPEDDRGAERIPIGDELRRWLASQSPQQFPDLLETAGQGNEYAARLAAQGGRSALLVPVTAESRPLALLTLVLDTAHEWSSTDLQFAATLANTIAVALQNARLFESIRQQKRDTEMILNSVFSGVFTTDLDGNVQTWNRAAFELTGLSEPNVRGKNWPQQIAHVFHDQPDGLIFEAMEAGDIVFGVAPRSLKHADGREIPLMEAAAPLRDVEGRIRGAVGAFWDLTKEHQAERAKHQFLEDISHDLRNTLTIMLSMSELLQSKVRGARRERAIQNIAGESDRIKEFAERFLHFEQEQAKQTVASEPIDIVELTSQMIARQESSPSAGRFELYATPARVEGDRARLESILFNLLDNAAKYSDGTAPVQVEIKPIGSEQVRLAVRNRGPTIPADQQVHIFERGFRLHLESPDGTPIEGNGIGLSLVRSKLLEMGGEICVESNAAEGTTFYFTLKRVRREDGQNQTKSSHRRRRPRSDLRRRARA